MKLLGLGHVAMLIRELEPAMDFYCNKLGFTLVTDNRKAGGSPVCYFVRRDGVTLELIVKPENPEPQQGVWNHVSLFVEDIEAAWRELKENGVQFETEQLLFDPNLYEHGEKYIMFRGPNNERLQLEQVL